MFVNRSVPLPWELLSNPAVGNLLILIASIVGVGGSWFLYQGKMNNRADSVRRSLIAEINSNNIFEDMKAEPPMHDVYSTAIYKSVGSDIALLTDDEIEAVSEVYSQIAKLRESQTIHGQLIRDLEMTDDLKDEQYNERNQMLIANIVILDNKSEEAVNKLRENLGLGYSGYSGYSVFSEENS